MIAPKKSAKKVCLRGSFYFDLIATTGSNLDAI